MNFLDYAFLQNAVDEHDKANKAESASIPWKVQPVYTDVRNILQSKAEMIAFALDRPAVGEKYGMYVNTDADSYNALTNWMGERFPYRVSFGRQWSRGDRYTLQTVYAEGDNGEKWRGTWSHEGDLVIMRRVK